MRTRKVWLLLVRGSVDAHRNRQVAEFLGERGFATLLLDLLTPEEEAVDVRTRSTGSTSRASEHA